MSDKVWVGQSATSLDIAPKFTAYTGVKLWRDDDTCYLAGDTTGTTGRVLESTCPWATPQMAEDMLASVSGYAYQPFVAQGAELDPAAELGDGITVGGVYGPLASADTVFDSACVSDISAPSEEEIDHEYPYQTPTERELSRKVTLGRSYYGTRITRANGLEITKTDDDGATHSRVILNSDLLAFYNDDGNEALYFDADAGKFKFTGILNVADKFLVNESGDVIVNGNINLSGGTITWGNNKPTTPLPSYLNSTYIGPTIIQSPTIEANDFNVKPSDEEDYTGSFNIYGMQAGAQFHMLGIEYQGYSSGDFVPYVNFSSPGGAYLRFNYGELSDVEFYGNVDFSGAHVSGFSNTSTIELDALDDVLLSAGGGTVAIRLDISEDRINFFVGGKTWVLTADGLSRLGG